MNKRTICILLVFALLLTPLVVSVVSVVPMAFNVSLSELIFQGDGGLLVPLKGGDEIPNYPRPR